MGSWTVLQMNAGRGREAMSFLQQAAAESRADLVLVQEPYEHGRGWTGDACIRTARNSKTLVVCRNGAESLILNEWCDVGCLVVRFRLEETTLVVANIYIAPGANMTTILHNIQCIVAKHTGPVIIAGDFNAKSPMWGGGYLRQPWRPDH